jgi:hypothetical protein
MHENGEKLVFVFRLHISFSSHSLLSASVRKSNIFGACRGGDSTRFLDI